MIVTGVEFFVRPCGAWQSIGLLKGSHILEDRGLPKDPTRGLPSQMHLCNHRWHLPGWRILESVSRAVPSRSNLTPQFGLAQFRWLPRILMNRNFGSRRWIQLLTSVRYSYYSRRTLQIWSNRHSGSIPPSSSQSCSIDRHRTPGDVLPRP